MASAKAWLSAFRLRTLPLAVSSILVGSALAKSSAPIYHFEFRPLLMCLALLTAILLQVLSNLANDVGDFEKGTDNADRIGPLRAVQSGAISPASMKRAMWICAILSFTSGLWLIYEAFGLTIETLLFLCLGLLAIGAAIKYTFGKNAYGYAGLGDVSVFLFFGIVGVAGTYYLFDQMINQDALILGSLFGLLSASVLNLNNMRDIENDKHVGKRTLAVSLGVKRSKVYQLCLVGIPIAMIVYMAIFKLLHADTLRFFILLIPVALFILVLRQSIIKEGRALDPLLKQQALSTFLLALLITGIAFF